MAEFSLFRARAGLLIKQLLRLPELHTYFLSVFFGNLQCPGVAVRRVQALPEELI
ncbi:hypothetical protein ACSAZK_07380 [Methanosarcina sp. Mfa9]|uniref:hypothetical protein n=1 Tax=Methanosarcina sp. Mfa9 TaxID=3439063 RepID=UPI003F829666